MLGFNWIDLLILGLLGLAIWQGVRIGFLTQLFGIIAFFCVLFLGGWLFPYLLPIDDRTLRTMLNTILVLSAALYAGLRASDLGQNIHWSFRLGKLIPRQNFKKTEAILGSLPSLAAMLVLVWLLGVAISRLPFAGFSNSVSDSRIIQTLVHHLPPAPAVFAGFNRQIDPNDLPKVLVKPKPYDDFSYSNTDVQMAAAKATDSIVRITSFGCGGLVTGSGFVVAPNLVATNAHVIAGVKRPIIKHQGHSYEGTPILFDAGLDLAILRTSQLNAATLTLASTPAKLTSTVAVLGYPGGNYTTSPGLIREYFTINSRNIYDVGVFGREAYGLQAAVEDGSSGGPVVSPDGKAIGMIFSKSTESSDYAYALASPPLSDKLSHVLKSHRRVSTGACVST